MPLPVKSWSVLPFLFASLALPSSIAVAAGEWQVIKVNGHDYLSVDNVSKFYGLPAEVVPSGAKIQSETADHPLEFVSGSREAMINGARSWLCFPVIEQEGKVLVSRTDVAKTIEPLVRPHRVPNVGKVQTVVLDPGHGGHDTGTIGSNGLLEKDLVLDVAKRLGKLLESRLGAEVVYTRQDDTFIPLETRTAIANRERADLFISIHANSSHDSDARGVETYYLNFTSSPEALEVAARENAVSEKSIHELQDLVKKIALKEKIEESREFAANVQQSLFTTLAGRGVRNRGVKKAPFIVLIGANMPSILAEISFVSNPTDAKRLKTSDYRQKIAEALYRGVAKYVSGLSGLKVASKVSQPETLNSGR